MHKSYLIWDLPLRLFHWLLVLTFGLLWLTAELGSEYMQYHMYCGYFMLFLIGFRLVWGFVGTKHAKFINFFPTFKRIKGYLTSDTNKRNSAVGHNPLGAIMVFVMLALLLAQAVSGLFITDDIFTSGPYNGVLEGDWQKLANRTHDIAFTLLQACVALHIVAIVFYKIVKHKDLIRPMLTGKKSSADVEEGAAIKHSKLLIALVVAVIVAVFVYWLVVINAPVIEAYYYY
ncbi:cytochrome b/b6 domain-containing protein [Thalassotalea sp. LPB0316]|uniref:cytochrome b/b6 domain-containing protein n=1 Tax=Thalassotalea sp. LPB0316 TaxID=2769490 RepID=UPI0018664EBE|nr:cytochrome b/b6 domain-containing protein [Thalassotalea sp. LPB0316]QOL24569.1 cytochrome b/b6 domain-containing protein [Thalassotalea sp. LPB0316]